MRLRTLVFALLPLSCSAASPIDTPAEETSPLLLPPAPPVVAPRPAAAAIDCQPCDGWWTIRGRKAICAGPSEQLFQAKLACVQSSCSGPCAAWTSSYAACMAGVDPSCEILLTDGCNACLTATNAAGGCHEELLACGDDLLGSVSCAVWLGGADPQRLAGRPVDAAPVDFSLDLTGCACAGPCAAACGAFCGLGLLEPVSASADAACWGCVGDPAGCSSELGACEVH